MREITENETLHCLGWCHTIETLSVTSEPESGYVVYCKGMNSPVNIRGLFALSHEIEGSLLEPTPCKMGGGWFNPVLF